MTIEFGNAGSLDTGGSGWFIGFGPWISDGHGASHPLRFMAEDRAARAFQMKWMHHPAGDDRGSGKPPRQRRTISMLVSESGAFRREFATSADFEERELIRQRLGNNGDYVIRG